MSVISTLLKRRGSHLCVALLLVALLVVPWNSASAQGGSVYGTVALPGGGAPPADTVVRLLKSDGSTFGQANVTSGAFNLSNVPNGNYIVRAVPPSLSAYTRSLPQPVSVINRCKASRGSPGWIVAAPTSITSCTFRFSLWLKVLSTARRVSKPTTSPPFTTG